MSESRNQDPFIQNLENSITIGPKVSILALLNFVKFKQFIDIFLMINELDEKLMCMISDKLLSQTFIPSLFLLKIFSLSTPRVHAGNLETTDIEERNGL